MQQTKRFGIAAAATLLILLVGGSTVPCSVLAQGANCSDGCRSTFASCYKTTSNRAACESQLQRCLQGCSSPPGKRG